MINTRETLPILLKAQKILLIGAGKVALQKAKVLSENHISFTVVASQILSSKMKSYCKNIEKKTFEITDIKTYFIVIDATGEKSVTQKLLAHKKTHTLLLNVVDKPEYCDFYFMALTANKPLQIAVTSHGISPTVAQYFRDTCEKLIPQGIDTFMEDLASKRGKGFIDKVKIKKDLENMHTKAYLVGCGLGDPELLTVKAYKIIQSVDIVLYDHLISKEIMDIIPHTTQKVFVGKQKGFHSKPQDEINEIILSYIQKGYKIARLKSGDPFIYGRGAEELLYLNAHKIKTEVVAGISSAISAPLMANIPLTARGIAQSFSVVSAHLQDSSINLDWLEQLRYEGHTVVVLMGLSRAKQIQDAAIDYGIDENKPCAIISNASRHDQTLSITTLKNLAIEAQKAQRPAVLVFGEVVNYPSQLKEIL